MKCSRCRKEAIINVLMPLCRNHFIENFEKKVKRTIKKYGLIDKNDKIAVAASGGKDSTTALYLMRKFFPRSKVEAIAIDEGIPGYREYTLSDLRKFCRKQKIKLNIYSYEKEFGNSLEGLIRKNSGNPCRICGVLRRYLLNRKSKGFTKLVTGHNLDDESQSVIMNIFKSHIKLMERLGPKTGVIKDDSFVPKVKPLYFCHQKEVAAYALLNKFSVRFAECPHAEDSYRSKIRDLLNGFELEYRGTKNSIISSFLKIKERLKSQPFDKVEYCVKCGEVAEQGVCAACLIKNAH